MRTITGSQYAGSYIRTADKDSLTILGALSKMNDPVNQAKVRGMGDLLPFVETVEGFNGHKESFESMRLFAVDDGLLK